MTLRADHDSRDPRRQRWVGAMSVAQIVSWGSLYYAFSPLLPALEADLGASRTEASAAFSLSLLVGGLLGLPIGRLIDGGRARLVMAGGSLAAALLLVAHSMVTSTLGLHLVWAGLGAAMACTTYEPAFAVLIRRWPTDYRRSLIALTVIGGLASTVFVPLTAMLIEAVGWRRTSLVLAALHLAICLPIHLRMLRGESPALPRTGGGASWRDPELRALALSPAFLLVTAFVASFMLLSAAVGAHIVPLLRERGLPEAWALAVPASVGALQAVGRLGLYLLERRIDPRRFDRIVPLLMPLALVVLLAGGASVVAAAVFAALYGLVNGMITIIKATAIAQYVSRERYATLTGLQALPNAVARALGPVAMAAMWSATGDYRLGLWVLSALAVVATVLLHLAQSRPPRPC